MANGIFELSSLLNSTALGLVINGIAASDNAGWSISSVGGGYNWDSFDDVIIGAPDANPSGKINAGQVYVVFDKSSFTLPLEFLSLNGTNYY
ncbi:MAG: integrin alpha [Candidatus Midichloria sp.]|nr:integrin alpha [Candidatus Midichloria sp.]